jgi:hypothetical protein
MQQSSALQDNRHVWQGNEVCVEKIDGAKELVRHLHTPSVLGNQALFQTISTSKAFNVRLLAYLSAVCRSGRQTDLLKPGLLESSIPELDVVAATFALF